MPLQYASTKYLSTKWLHKTCINKVIRQYASTKLLHKYASTKWDFKNTASTKVVHQILKIDCCINNLYWSSDSHTTNCWFLSGGGICFNKYGKGLILLVFPFGAVWAKRHPLLLSTTRAHPFFRHFFVSSHYLRCQIQQKMKK